DVDQLAANRQNRLITPIPTLFRGTACRVALDNVKLRQFRIALRTIREFPGQSTTGERAFADCFPGFSSSFPRSRRSENFVEDAARNRRIFVEVSHQPVI